MKSLLESLSLALSEQTGFAPELCYLLVLDLLLLLVITVPKVVIAVLFAKPRPPEPPEVVPESFEEAQPPGTTPAPVLWGARWLHHEMQKYQLRDHRNDALG